MLDWLFGAGIGTNLGASLVWGVAAGVFGYWLKGHVARFHAHFAALHASHADLHQKLAKHASAIEALHQRVSDDGRAKPARPARRPAPPK